MDAPRILPPKHVPTCDKVHIDIPDYVTPLTGRKRRKVREGAGTGASAGPSVPASITRSAFLDPEELARFQRRYLISKRDQARAQITFPNACKNMLEGRKRSTMNVATTSFRVGHSTRTLDLIKAVNRISKARVDQSLAGVMDSTAVDDIDGVTSSELKSEFWKSMLKDSYSRRMLAMYESTPEFPALEEPGTKSRMLTASVTKPAKGTTTENTRPNTSGLYGHLEALDDDEFDSLHQGQGHGKKKLPRRPRLFSEDRDASNTGTATNSNSDDNDVIVGRSVYKRPQPQARSRRKQATVTESTTESRTTTSRSGALVKDRRPQQPHSRSLSPDSDSLPIHPPGGSGYEKIQSYFNNEASRPSERPDDGDMVVDRAAMDELDFDFEYNDVQEPDQDWMPMASDPVNDDRVPSGEDMGFNFSEPSTPPQWYSSGSPTSTLSPGKGLNQEVSSVSNKTIQGLGHSTQQKRKRLLSDDENDAWHDPFALLQSGTAQLLALPPVPESGRWYRKTKARLPDRPSVELLESDEDDPTELFQKRSASTNSKAELQDVKEAVNNVLERTKEDDDIGLNDIMFIESSQEETAPPPLPRESDRTWEQRRHLPPQEERHQHIHPSAKASVRNSENGSNSRSNSSNHYSSFMSARDLHLNKSDSAVQQSSKSEENRGVLNNHGSSGSSSSKPAQALSKAPKLKSLWGDPEEDSFEDDDELW